MPVATLEKPTREKIATAATAHIIITDEDGVTVLRADDLKVVGMSLRDMLKHVQHETCTALLTDVLVTEEGEAVVGVDLDRMRVEEGATYLCVDP